MAKKMLIDATHGEETRVVVVEGNKVEEFDFESENKRQLAGNIYLAKVTRVEPSLQAAFVDYGGNRHGFLAFSEIHPDYYQIPVADREALLAEEIAYAQAQKDEDEKPKRSRRRVRSRSKVRPASAKEESSVATSEIEAPLEENALDLIDLDVSEVEDLLIEDGVFPASDAEAPIAAASDVSIFSSQEQTLEEALAAELATVEGEVIDLTEGDSEAVIVDAEELDQKEASEDDAEDEDKETAADRDETIESIADDDTPDEIRPKRIPRPRRYKIQEVINVRQILLIQVVKEERGNKGAAVTTYLSLAGRYCVLMPNTARGGGISRKITNIADRKKLKEIAGSLSVPQGAGLIIRTAGSQRSKVEIKRDYEYLKRMWEQIRELTLKSIAPAKIYEEGNLIKRSIRDLYSKEIDEVVVDGEAGFLEARGFMKMIMPTHAKHVKAYREKLPLFTRYQVESYLSSMFNPVVQLKSGGYIVIDVTEALVAVDVNSGRATKEGSIEETALRTNIEAAEEVARQARLRDLAGLIVIDFIDMEERRNNSAVEKRLKDKLKSDRARIQVGRISGFGLLEMSRQRLRPGMLEATTQPCPHCHGTGLVRSDDNMALNILRQIEEEGTRRRTREVLLKAPVAVVNYLMNMKREAIAQIEASFDMSVRIEADPAMISPDFSLEKFKTATRVLPKEKPPVVSASLDLMADYDDEQLEEESTEELEQSEEQTTKKKRRRRRRRKNGVNDVETHSEASEATDNAETSAEVEEGAAEEEPQAQKPRRTRRSRSRNQKDNSNEVSQSDEMQIAEPEDSNESLSSDTPETSSEDKEDVKPRRRRRSAKKDRAAEVGTAEQSEEGAQSPSEQDAPKPRRRRRTKVEARTEVAPEVTAEVAPEGTTGAAADNDATEVEKAEDTPKPKRRRRTKAEIEAAKLAKTSETEGSEASEEAPKPKRRRRTKAEIEAEKAASQAEGEEAAPKRRRRTKAETEDGKAISSPKEDTSAPSATASEAPVAKAEPVAVDNVAPVAVEKPQAVEQDGPPKKKKRGWWSRT